MKTEDEKIKLAAKIEARIKSRAKMALRIEELINELSKEYKALIDHDLRTYPMLTKPDCLYGDSPVSSAFTNEWLKQQFLKNDLAFLSGLYLDGVDSLKTFSKRAEESSGWMMRFTKEPEKEKSGIEAILD